MPLPIVGCGGDGNDDSNDGNGDDDDGMKVNGPPLALVFTLFREREARARVLRFAENATRQKEAPDPFLRSDPGPRLPLSVVLASS